MNPAVKVSNKIKQGSWPQEILKIIQFFTSTITGELVPNSETRIQVRANDRDIDRINRVVNKIQATGDRSGIEPLCVVRYPDGTLKLLNGNHTVEIQLYLGDTEANCYIVDFVEDLGGKESNVVRLGNLLNTHDIERVSVEDSDIRNELYILIEENGGKLSAAQKEEFCATYPVISKNTVGQWESNHGEVGGRRKPRVTWTEGQLKKQVDFYKGSEKYADYTVLTPRNLRGALETGISQAFIEMQEDGTRKCLIPLFCGSVAEVEKWKNGTAKENITKKYAKLSKYYDVVIEFDMLRYE